MPLFSDQSPMEYDAIVVGSGISGGWAAKELCEKGLKTLVLERGRNVEHGKDYDTANLERWQLPNNGEMTAEQMKDYPKQKRTGYTIGNGHAKFFVKDTEHPYYEKPNTRFDWIRGYQVGGRSLVWGRQSYRWSPMDFESNAREGVAIPWPIGYDDVAPWYDYVERFAGISGQKEGLRQLPDSLFLEPMALNAVEKDLKEKIKNNYNDRMLTIGRVAHITSNTDQFENRGSCQFRNRCMRGCPYGGYFSSNAATLPAAEKTGNLTLRPFSIGHQVMYDENKKSATGIQVIDQLTKKTYEFKAKIIFLCASTVGSTSILMQSTSNRYPNGMGNDSGELGHNIMDHHFQVGATAKVEGFDNRYYKGRRPNGYYIPRFRNLPWMPETKKDFLRGYQYQGGASREGWSRSVAEMSYGGAYKDEMMTPGDWTVGMNAFGEILPYHDNEMVLNNDKKDKWGLPTVTFSTTIRENEEKMREDMKEAAVEIYEKAGYKDVQPYDRGYGIGLGIHEMGTARMGNDPKTSVLNKHNQIHDCKNVFVTDGSCMTSAACQNPSLTYMALTARAADYAVSELKKQNL